MGRVVLRGIAILIALALGGVALLGSGLLGRHEAPGQITPTPRPHPFTEALRAGQARAARALGAADGKQIVFGDLHVHTTFSSDAFLFSLPILGGEGAHPGSERAWSSPIWVAPASDH